MANRTLHDNGELMKRSLEAKSLSNPDLEDTDFTNGTKLLDSYFFEDNLESILEQTSLKRKSVSLLEDLDEKYAGKKRSRKELAESDGEQSDDSYICKNSGSYKNNEMNIMSDSSLKSDGTSESEQEQYVSNKIEQNGKKMILSEHNYDDEEITNEKQVKYFSKNAIEPTMNKKSQSVRNQLKLWEILLEIRIQLQKCLIASNKMPQFEIFKELSNEAKFREKASITGKILSDTLEQLLKAQGTLLKQYPETNILKKKILVSSNCNKKRSISNYGMLISNFLENYREIMHSVINKWDEKTKVLTKNVGSIYTTLQKISYSLQVDKEKLIKQTQMKNDNYNIIGKIVTKSEEDKFNIYCPEIYDDGEFYLETLNDFINCKSKDCNVTQQMLKIQELKTKPKKSINRTGACDRRLKYIVHQRLQNFMAPYDDSSYTDKAKDELYCSIFGKNI